MQKIILVFEKKKLLFKKLGSFFTMKRVINKHMNNAKFGLNYAGTQQISLVTKKNLMTKR